MGFEGIIRPPPDIRAVADKTAIFVAKNGRDFEKRILNSAKGKTPKFAFLHESSPFHAYYEDRIVFYANGGAEEEKKKEKEKEEQLKKEQEKNQNKDDDKENEATKEEEEAQDKSQPKETSKTMRKAKSIVDPVAKSLLAQRAKIKQMHTKTKEISTDGDGMNNKDDSKINEEIIEKHKDDKQNEQEIHPPKIIYTTPIPPRGISQCQLEIIKTTAQFAALNQGDKNKNHNPFLRELIVLEWQNPIYGFLQPRHAHYAYFTQLIDIYIRILQRSVLIHEQNVMKKRDQDQTTSLLAITSLKRMVGMDGVDFAETTGVELKNEIQAVDNMANNVYKCLDYAAFHAEYDRFNEEKRQAEIEKMMNEDGSNGMLGGSSRVDWYDFVVVETIDFPVNEVVESLPPPPPPLPPPPHGKVDKPRSYDTMEVEDDDDDDDDDEKETIKVVSDYAPKVVSAQDQFASESRTHVIDPITKRSIPIADMSEHMRIQLLDPKWAAEKERFMEKQKDSNLVGGDMIARNVDAFTKARGFGSSTNNDSNQTVIRSGANEISIEHSVGPQPIGSVPTSAATTQHVRPPMTLPDAKRVKFGDTTIPGQSIQLEMPPPIMQNKMHPPPPPLSTVPPSTEVKEAETGAAAGPTRLSEVDFADSLSNPMVDISIIVPNDASYSSWNFNGQTINISIDVMTKIKGLKQKLQTQLGGMPVNKMQLKSPDVGFLKDAFSLAKLNIASHSPAIELVPKVRGGRK